MMWPHAAPDFGKAWEGMGWDNLWDAIFYFISKDDVVNVAITHSVVVLDVWITWKSVGGSWADSQIAGRSSWHLSLMDKV